MRLDILAPTRDTVRTALCKGESYRIGNQVYSRAGTYQAYLPKATARGCDSIVVLVLEQLNDPVYTVRETICKGDTLSLAGKSYATLGLHQDTLFGAAANGCDSLISLTLSFHPDAAHKIRLPLCVDQTLMVNGEKIEKPGI